MEDGLTFVLSFGRQKTTESFSAFLLLFEPTVFFPVRSKQSVEKRINLVQNDNL